MQVESAGIPGAETLPSETGEARVDRRVTHAEVAVGAGDFAGQARADAAVAVADVVGEVAARCVGDGIAHVIEHAGGEGAGVARLVACFGAILGGVAAQSAGSEDGTQVEPSLSLVLAVGQLEQVGPSNQVLQSANAQPRQPLPNVFGHELEEIRRHIRQAGEMILAQPRILRRHARRTIVQVANTQILAAQRHHRRRAKAKTLRTQYRTLDDIEARFQAAIHLHAHAMAQVVAAQGFLDFRQAQFPGRAGMVDGRHRRRARAAVVTRHGDQVRIRLHHTGSDGADAGMRDQLHRHQRGRIHFLQVVDELGQVFDRIDVVVRRRRDQADAGLGVAQPRDELVDFVARQLAAFARLGTLRDLDLQYFGMHEVFGRDTESSGRNLFDLGRLIGVVPRRVFAAFTGIGARAE